MDTDTPMWTRYKGRHYRLVLAQRPLKFTITKAHVEVATCGDPGYCVVAQALRDRFFHENLTLSVGPHTVKIVAGDVLYKYSTSEKLRAAILAYDATKDSPAGPSWDLSPGEYQLNKYEGRMGWKKLHARDKAEGPRKPSGKLRRHKVSMETPEGDFHSEKVRVPGRFIVPACMVRKAKAVRAEARAKES